MEIVQTTEYIKPYSSGEYVTKQADSKLINIVANDHSKEVPIISTLAALEQFDDSELPIKDKMNFASVESNNKFKDEDVGIVLGSPEWKIHKQVKLIGAFMKNCISYNGCKGTEKSFGEVGDPIMEAFREDMVGQAILRFGRDSEVSQSTVYAHTAAIPDDIPVSKTFDSEMGGSYTSTAEQIRRYMSRTDKEVFETSGICDAVESHDKHIMKELKEKSIFERVVNGTGRKPSKWSLLY
jgi:hypothetical protein